MPVAWTETASAGIVAVLMGSSEDIFATFEAEYACMHFCIAAASSSPRACV